jgi:uncharacterized protein (TIGR03118 family)
MRHFMRTWFPDPYRLFRVPSGQRRAPRRRPSIEVLEDRRVPTGGTGYTQLNLVSDQANTALLTDPNLVDAWGIGLSPFGGEFFVSDNVPGVATQYGGAVNGSPFTRDPLVVQIPFGSPSGAVFNGTASFKLNDGNPARFLVSQETPWAGGWDPGLQPPTSGQFVVDTVPAAAVYKGITIAQVGTSNFLYLANIRSGAIEVYDAQFNRVTLSGTFTDPNLPAGFAPFNVEAINVPGVGTELFVTYAKQNQNKDGDVPGAGNGFVDVFKPDGTFVKRLVSNGPLNSPWGLALAPGNFGDLSGDLLVGNFGDGAINAFNPTSGAFAGTLNDAAGNPMHIDGLWGLQFGNGVSAGDGNVLFFSAGPLGETHGLFGALHANGANPLTGTGSGMLTGTAGMPLQGVLATFADANPGKTAADFNVTITINGQTSAGIVTANASGTGFSVTGPDTNPPAGSDAVTITIQEKGTGGASLTVNALAVVAAAPGGPTGTSPTSPMTPVTTPTPTATPGQRFVTQVVHDLVGQAADAQALQRFGGEFDQGAAAGRVALDLVDSFGKSLHRVVRQLTGGGSTSRRARRLFQNLVNHAPDPKGDAALLRGVTRKLARRATEDQALALVLGSPGYLAKVLS